jgi:GNAT superfamily N-acetyltransferase
VAHSGDLIVGTFGLERAEGQAMELQRMYVHPAARRAGIARQMLQFAEGNGTWHAILPVKDRPR